MVVHAGRIPNVSLKDQSPWDYVNMRNLIQSPNSGNSYSSGKMYKASDRAKEGEAWAGVWNDDQCHIYFGHDAKRELQLYPHATGLDTGACYGKYYDSISISISILIYIYIYIYFVTVGICICNF